MLPLSAVAGFIRDTYREQSDETLVGFARLLDVLNDQSEEILKTAHEEKETGH